MSAIARVLAGLLLMNSFAAVAQDSAKYRVSEGDFVARNFKFRSGEQLADLRLHYKTLGQPTRDAGGRVTNAVMLLHSTSGSSTQFLVPQFAGELFGPGQLLDTSRYFIVIPDNIGHGKSSKPSDGMHAHFPHYDYDDMVLLQHMLLTEGLGVQHLRLILGTSMGCMHSFVWGEAYPTFMDAMMPLACLPVQIAGRNRVWRKMLMDAITKDPEWKNGEYKEEPKQAMRTVHDIFALAGSAPVAAQKNLPTRDAADKYVEDTVEAHLSDWDANDFLYAFDASRDYDPSAHLEDISVPVMWINSADDFINPPELGIAERLSKRLKRGTFVLLPISENTRGHGTHTWAVAWKQYLAQILNESAR
jgi:homoserine O-acetyltransferase/O-succinyltransferase